MMQEVQKEKTLKIFGDKKSEGSLKNRLPSL